jgi:hypothetical protein
MSLKDFYYDQKTGFLTAHKLFRKAKEAGIPTTWKETKAFVKNQLVLSTQGKVETNICGT